MSGCVRSSNDFGFDPNLFLFDMGKRNPRVAFDGKGLSALPLNKPSQYAEECGTTNKIIYNAHKLDLRSISWNVHCPYATYGCCGGSAPIGASVVGKTASRSRNGVFGCSDLGIVAPNLGCSCHTQEDRLWLTTHPRHHLAAAFGCIFWQGALFLSCFTRSLRVAARQLSILLRLLSLRLQALKWRQPLANNPITHKTPTCGGRNDAPAVFRALMA